MDNTRDYYADVVHSIALIIEGLKSRFPEKARDSYVNKLIELSRVPIDFSDQDEVEEKTSVLYKVAYGFYVLLTVYKDDKEFLGIFRIQSKQKKNVITEFLKFIGANEFYKKRIFKQPASFGQPNFLCMGRTCFSSSHDDIDSSQLGDREDYRKGRWERAEICPAYWHYMQFRSSWIL